MKIAILLMGLFSAMHAQAANSPCKAMAVKAAMKAYLSQGTVQGDAPVPSHRLISIKDDIAKHEVKVSGGNDEGESWTIVYQIKTDIQNNCKVNSVKKIKVL